MKFMAMHKHDKNTELGMKPPPALITAMGQLVGGLAQSGRLLDGAGLGATARRSRLSLRGGQRQLVHGPFSAGSSNELPAGYHQVKVASRDEAIEWAAQLGQAIGGDVDFEIGRVNEPWDLGIGEKPADAPEKYLLVQKATPATEAGARADLSGVRKAMAERGVLMTSGELTPSSQGKRLTWRGGKRTVIDGPFAESKEMIGGYVVLDLASFDECLAFCTTYSEILLTLTDSLELDLRPVAS